MQANILNYIDKPRKTYLEPGVSMVCLIADYARKNKLPLNIDLTIYALYFAQLETIGELGIVAFPEQIEASEDNGPEIPMMKSYCDCSPDFQSDRNLNGTWTHSDNHTFIFPDYIEGYGSELEKSIHDIIRYVCDLGVHKVRNLLTSAYSLCDMVLRAKYSEKKPPIITFDYMEEYGLDELNRLVEEWECNEKIKRLKDAIDNKKDIFVELKSA